MNFTIALPDEVLHYAQLYASTPLEKALVAASESFVSACESALQKAEDAEEYADEIASECEHYQENLVTSLELLEALLNYTADPTGQPDPTSQIQEFLSSEPSRPPKTS